MKIVWLGHACFLLETEGGTKIVTDPYEPNAYSGAIGYLPVSVSADAVTVSHQHADHNFTADVHGAKVIDKPGTYKVKDTSIEGILSYHDSVGGSQRGSNIIFIFSVESLKIVHFGDLGTLDIDYHKLSNIDVALIPVGGTFTLNYREASALIERLKPTITVPMHFKTPKLGFDIDGVDKFIKGKTNVEHRDILEINKEELASLSPRIVVLKNQR